MATVPYTFLRGMELEGTHPNDVGGWNLTVHRLEAGEGVPLMTDPASWVEVASAYAYPPAPKLPASSRVRFPYYRRTRSAAECERFIQATGLDVPVSLEMFAGWANPPEGIIPMPAEDESALGMTHVVALSACLPEQRQFRFQNTWGGNWGDNGFGFISYDYIDKYTFESWVTYASVSFEFTKSKQLDTGVHRQWVLRDEWDRRIYGFDIWDKRERDRFGWAFVLENDGVFEIEELYVRPEFRKRGLGRALAVSVRDLARAKRRPLRLWVPFADCKRENPSNYEALVAMARLLGVQYQPCPVIWAAYYATSDRAGEACPIEPRRIPERPKSTLAGVLAAAMTVSSGAAANEGPKTAVVASAVDDADSPAVGTQAWETMNARRAELISKKYDHGLTPEEQREYECLQRLSQAALERAFPPPRELMEQIDRLEAELRGRTGASAV